MDLVLPNRRKDLDPNDPGINCAWNLRPPFLLDEALVLDVTRLIVDELDNDSSSLVVSRSPGISDAPGRIDPMSDFGNGFSPGWQAATCRFDYGDRSRSGSQF